MSCTDPPDELFAAGEWMDAAYCWLTSGGDPTLTILVPTLVYGTILTAYFIVGQSIVIPVVVSIILAGVIFVAFPASGVTLALLAIIMGLTVGGIYLSNKVGR